MTFASREISPYNGRPFHLYRFKIGPAAEDVICYTNVAMEYEHEGLTYLPLAITHSEVVSSSNLDKAGLTISAPDESELAQIYAGQPPSYVVTLVIFQGHVGDADFKVCWAGRAMSGNFVGEHDETLELGCDPIVSSLRRPGLSRDYQYACPLVLYGQQCRASRPTATRTAAVVGVNGPFVQLPVDWAPAALKPKHIGGIAEWTNAHGRTERRSIIDVEGDVVQVSSFPNDLAADATLTVVLGCNHLMDDCRDVHANILNFGGQPEIPTKNPFGITNNYY